MSPLSRFILSAILASIPALPVCAQESLPDGSQSQLQSQSDSKSDSQPVSQPDYQSDRIVEGRPALYTFKRVAHPLSWLEFALKPVLRSSETGKIHELLIRKRETIIPGVKFGISGAGVGSGIGPQVTVFKRDLLGRGINVEMPLLYTYSQYQVYAFNSSVPLIYDGVLTKLSFDFSSAYRSRARDDIFGLGNESPRADEKQFRTVTRELSARLTARLRDDWKAEAFGAYRSVGVTKPTSGSNAQEFFTTSSLPGLFGATLRTLGITIGRDTGERKDYTFKGGSNHLEISFNDAIGNEPFQYWRYHFDAERFFWLTSDGRKVIAARGLIETNRPTAGHQVPFFDMPVLGATQTLRGFENFRFRDQSALGLTLEYRYRIWPRMDWGFFVDEGQVATRVRDFAFNRFHTGYGTRFFVWATPNVPISFDLGFSRETWRLYVNLNTTF
jgi:outer membrane protein assembly factor BamA